MRAALLILLCLPASASEPRDIRHDRDGDGVVTDQEERQARRDERRARRAERRGLRPGGTEEDDGGSTTEEDAQRQSAAAGRAARMADAMKAMLPGADAGALGPAGGGPAGASARPPSAGAPAAGGGAGSSFAAAPPPSGSSGDPANPRTAADLLLAARGPYAPALEKAGLKLAPDGRGFLRLSDGKPATPEDLERLRAGVLAMPAAMMRRPDFYRKVSPEHFAALQTGYRQRRSPSVYKDVAATEKERDFVHSRSCERLSGECNAHVEKPSYKKGDYVTPEDLERMYQGLEEELAGSAEYEAEERPALGRGPRALPGDEELFAGEAPAAGPAPGEKPASSAAAREQAAYAATPAFLAAPVRRALAKTMAFVSPAGAGGPLLDGRGLLALTALAACLLYGLRVRG